MNPGRLLDAVLAVGWLAALTLATSTALLATALGYWTGTHLAIRYQGRRLAHYCQLYIRHPGIRAALDSNYQPRKETP